MKNVSIVTLGCKVNQFESASFADNLQAAGCTIVGQDEQADVIIINTCTVTGAASAHSRKAIRQALRSSPDAKVIISGCYVEIGAQEIAKIAEIKGRDFQLIGNSRKDTIVQAILKPEKYSEQLLLGTISEATSICRLPVRRFGDRTRTYLRIQDGCESFCTYCIVPYTRGPSRSLPAAEVLEQAKIFVDEGYAETVLTGIHIGAWGQDLEGKQNFTDLLAKLSSEIPAMRFRISSLEPMEIDDLLLQLIAERDNIFPHLHIPLQSGEDEILTRMNRKYTTAEFGKIIENCHNHIPEICIGIDILAGFPGETDVHFEQAYAFLENLNFCYLHVFPYSIRPGTQAAEFTDQIHGDIKNSRVKKLRLLSDKKKSVFYQKQLGKVRAVQVEGKRAEDGFLRGYTDNYTLVHFNGPDSLMRSTVNVTLISNQHNHVIGEAII